jgi:hypothetical protein
MALALTPRVLQAAYDYLCETDPFRRWNLPDSEDVVFKVNKNPKVFGFYYLDHGGKHTIEASCKSIAHTETLMKLMSHEMIHLHLQITGWETKSTDPNVHNAAFRKFAAQACKHHGWDIKAFF